MVLILILLASLVFGCTSAQKPAQTPTPPVVALSSPASNDETAFVFERVEPAKLERPKVMKPPVRRARRDPFAGDRKVEKPASKKLKPPPPPEPAKKQLSLNLGGESNYPTYQGSPDPNKERLEEAAISDSEAFPTYHPSVKLMELVDNPFLDVRFAVAADGSFEPTLLNPSGDPILDRIILRTLNRWRWQPKLVDGTPVASTVVLRLKKVVKVPLSSTTS